MSDVFYDAFISYSTQDSDFVTALRLALEANGRRVWQDVKELELTAEWWAQIRQGIAAADNFLFVVSPRSMASPICHLELEHARELQKRVIVIRYEAADKTDSTRMMIDRILTQNYLRLLTTGRDMFGVAEANWASIEAEQNITIATKDDLLTAVPRLVEAFDKDLLYIRQANILLGRAREWSESGNNASFLLVGEALKAAEAWRIAGKSPAPTADHIAYIEASRAAEHERLRQLAELESRREAAERATEQVQRKLRQEQRAGAVTAGFGGLVIGLAVMATVFALQLLGGVQGQVRDANIQLSGVAPTVTELNVLAVTAKAASDEAENAIVTATQVAQAAVERQGTLDALSTKAIAIELRVTEAFELSEFASVIAEVVRQPDKSTIEIGKLNALILDHPEQMIALAPRMALAYSTRGKRLLDAEDYQGAIDDYTQAIALRPLNADSYNERGFAYYGLREYEKAIADYNHALTLKRDGVSYYYLGLVYYDLGNSEQALYNFTQAVEIRPQLALGYYALGQVYSEKGEFERAVTEYNLAIVYAPRDAAPYVARGLAYMSLGDNALAKADLDHATSLDPQLADAYHGRGLLYTFEGKYEQAITEYDLAIMYAPNEASAYTHRGLVYYELDNDEQAMADFDRAIGLDPEQVDAYYHRGLMYGLDGEYEKSLADFRAFERLGGELGAMEKAIMQDMENALEQQRARQTPTP